MPFYLNLNPRAEALQKANLYITTILDKVLARRDIYKLASDSVLANKLYHEILQLAPDLRVVMNKGDVSKLLRLAVEGGVYPFIDELASAKALYQDILSIPHDINEVMLGGDVSKLDEKTARILKQLPRHITNVAYHFFLRPDTGEAFRSVWLRAHQRSFIRHYNGKLTLITESLPSHISMVKMENLQSLLPKCIWLGKTLLKVLHTLPRDICTLDLSYITLVEEDLSIIKKAFAALAKYPKLSTLKANNMKILSHRGEVIRLLIDALPCTIDCLSLDHYPLDQMSEAETHDIFNTLGQKKSLKTLSIKYNRHMPQLSFDFFNHMFSHLNQMHLLSLDLSGYQLDNLTPESITMFFNLLPHSLQTMFLSRYLFDSLSYPQRMALVSALPQNLQSLISYPCHNGFSDQAKTLSVLQALPNSLSNIEFDVDYVQLDTVVTFFRQLTDKICSLKIPKIDERMAKAEVIKLFQSLPKGLIKLDLSNNDFLDEDNWQERFQYLPQSLKVIRIAESSLLSLSPTDVKTFLAHLPPALEVIDLSCKSGCPNWSKLANVLAESDKIILLSENRHQYQFKHGINDLKRHALSRCWASFHQTGLRLPDADSQGLIAQYSDVATFN